MCWQCCLGAVCCPHFCYAQVPEGRRQRLRPGWGCQGRNRGGRRIGMMPKQLQDKVFKNSTAAADWPIGPGERGRKRVSRSPTTQDKKVRAAFINSFVSSTKYMYIKVVELFGSRHQLKETNGGIDLRRSHDIDICEKDSLFFTSEATDIRTNIIRN
jgi:hypothetical protein